MISLLMDNHFFLNYLVKKETLGIGYIFIMILKILEEMQDQIGNLNMFLQEMKNGNYMMMGNYSI